MLTMVAGPATVCEPRDQSRFADSCRGCRRAWKRQHAKNASTSKENKSHLPDSRAKCCDLRSSSGTRREFEKDQAWSCQRGADRYLDPPC